MGLGGSTENGKTLSDKQQQEAIRTCRPEGTIGGGMVSLEPMAKQEGCLTWRLAVGTQLLLRIVAHRE